MWRGEFGAAKFFAGVVAGVVSSAVLAVLISFFSSEQVLRLIVHTLGGITETENEARMARVVSGASLRYPNYKFAHYSGFSHNDCQKHLFKTLQKWPYEFTPMPGNLTEKNADGANIYLPEGGKTVDLILSFRCYTFSMSDVPGDTFNLVFVTSGSLGRSSDEFDRDSLLDEFFDDFDADLPSGVSKGIQRIVTKFLDGKVVIDDQYRSFPVTTEQTIDFFWLNVVDLKRAYGMHSPPSIAEIRDLLIRQ